MRFQQFTVKTQFPPFLVMSAIQRSLPVPASGSWPNHAARVDKISSRDFDVFVVREKMWPFVVSATMNQATTEVAFHIWPYHATIVTAACMFSVPLLFTLWVSVLGPSAEPFDTEAVSMLWQAVCVTAGWFGGQVWWQSKCVGQTIRQILTGSDAASH